MVLVKINHFSGGYWARTKMINTAVCRVLFNIGENKNLTDSEKPVTTAPEFDKCSLYRDQSLTKKVSGHRHGCVK